MTEREALNLALQALETLMIERGSIYDKATTAIREALTQQEQHQDWCASLTQMLMSMPPKPAPCNCKPPQRTWVGLRDDEIYSVLENLQVMHHRPPTTDSRVIFAQAIEAKLKAKNVFHSTEKNT